MRAYLSFNHTQVSKVEIDLEGGTQILLGIKQLLLDISAIENALRG